MASETKRNETKLKRKAIQIINHTFVTQCVSFFPIKTPKRCRVNCSRESGPRTEPNAVNPSLPGYVISWQRCWRGLIEFLSRPILSVVLPPKKGEGFNWGWRRTKKRIRENSSKFSSAYIHLFDLCLKAYCILYCTDNNYFLTIIILITALLLCDLN